LVGFAAVAGMNALVGSDGFVESALENEPAAGDCAAHLPRQSRNEIPRANSSLVRIAVDNRHYRKVSQSEIASDNEISRQ